MIRNDTSSLMAKIKDYSTLNHVASILVRKGVLFGDSWDERRAFRRKPLVLQPKPFYSG